MKEVFAYVIGLGASVMMPVIFTILGTLIGIKFSKALRSGLLVGVGFVGLGVVTGLLTNGAHNLGSSLWCWLIYHLTVSFKWIGAIGAGALAAGMCFVNWKRIRKVQ